MEIKLTRRNRKPLTFSLLLIPFIIPLGTTGYGEPIRGVTDTTIKIGLIADLTGPSAGDIGLPIFNGLTTYTKHINDRGGIFGRKVKLSLCFHQR